MNPERSPRSIRHLPDRRLTEAELREFREGGSGSHWSVETADGSPQTQALALVRSFRFPDFHHTMAFVNAVAWIAHEADHHPDLTVGYNRCQVRWSTHSAGGLTPKDLACAAQVDALQCP